MLCRAGASLDWEALEQTFVWQLVLADLAPADRPALLRLLLQDEQATEGATRRKFHARAALPRLMLFPSVLAFPRPQSAPSMHSAYCSLCRARHRPPTWWSGSSPRPMRAMPLRARHCRCGIVRTTQFWRTPVPPRSQPWRAHSGKRRLSEIEKHIVGADDVLHNVALPLGI